MIPIRIAIAGIGNCASSLVQGIHYYKANPSAPGLKHPDLGGYRATDVQVVAAFDIDARKVGKPLEEAIFALPNNTKDIFKPVPSSGVAVQMGPVLDGFPSHMLNYPEHQRFVAADKSPVDVAAALRSSGAEILLNYMPVGSQQATEFYADACLRSGVSLINCMPVFIVSDPQWGRKFKDRGVPCVDDDVKAQLGATITHRMFARLFQERGVKIDSTYQLNTGGNTDFLNMLSRDRLKSKKISKTDAVQSQLDVPLEPDQIHIGPSDFIPFQKDNKVCFMRLEGVGFGGVPLNVEIRLSVEDSPNSAGVVIDAIRALKLARDGGMSGPIEEICAWTMKHPPLQMTDGDALAAMHELVARAAAKAEAEPSSDGNRNTGRVAEATRTPCRLSAFCRWLTGSEKYASRRSSGPDPRSTRLSAPPPA
jgi:myo-inositol-1-phosphate synthase